MTYSSFNGSFEYKQAQIAALQLNFHTARLEAWSHARLSVSPASKSSFDRSGGHEELFDSGVQTLFTKFKELQDKVIEAEMDLLKDWKPFTDKERLFKSQWLVKWLQQEIEKKDKEITE